jgi:hypothetical protein
VIEGHVYHAVWVSEERCVSIGRYIQDNHIARQILEKDVHLGDVGLKVNHQTPNSRLGDPFGLGEIHRRQRQKEQGENQYGRD